jgi:hypothetical protein
MVVTNCAVVWGMMPFWHGRLQSRKATVVLVTCAVALCMHGFLTGLCGCLAAQYITEALAVKVVTQ